jgi:hypothetical protein
MQLSSAMLPVDGASVDSILAAEQKREQWEEFIFRMCERSLLFFLFGDERTGYNGVRAVDAHDGRAAVKPIPKHPYMRAIAQMWEREKLLVLVKSRQMTMTWLLCACYLWDTLFHIGRQNFIVSEKLEKAHESVNRCGILYYYLPDFIKKRIPCPRGDKYFCSAFAEFNAPTKQSYIKGVGQGATQFNQYTCSGIFFDEAGLQAELEETYGAAFPTVVGGGRLTVVGSVRGRNFFHKLYLGGAQ